MPTDSRDALAIDRHQARHQPLVIITITQKTHTQPGSSVMVFIWNSTSQTTTLIEEYAPGPLDVICGPVAGGCEDHKHKDHFEAARHELEEEERGGIHMDRSGRYTPVNLTTSRAKLKTKQAELVGGTWHLLLESEETTAVADKYSTAPFRFYLVVVRLVFLARCMCGDTFPCRPVRLRPMSSFPRSNIITNTNFIKPRTPSSSRSPSRTTTRSYWSSTGA